jgi:two-component system, chemotaxis family, CheB/CheR fusion protein
LSSSKGAKDPAFEQLLDYLKQNRGFDFSGYKRSSLMRRFQRRMQVRNLESFNDYLDYLEVHPEEFKHLFNSILINVTSFFRDTSAWDYLGQEVIPRIISGKLNDDAIRVWSAGCSSGEEAYTLAIVLAEALGEQQFRTRVKIYATDCDEEALAQARQASYAAKAVQAVPEALRQRYFEPIGDRYVFQHNLRRSVIFGRHDLIQDAPISRIDLLTCRNTLMYFNAETQARILNKLYFSLDSQGFLFLGKAEMLLTHSSQFLPVDLPNRIFARVPPLSFRDRLLVVPHAEDRAFPDRFSQNSFARYNRLQAVAFDASPVAQIIIDSDGNLLFANEQARMLFSLSVKDVGRPFQDLELSYRPVDLRSPIQTASEEHRSIVLPNVERHFLNGKMQNLEVCVAPLYDDEKNAIGIGISFTDISNFVRLQNDLKRTSQELDTAYEELQSANEELETTNEELQSTIEVLETTNEELQSTNEELETMNQELQSTNEELQTINQELLQRTDELNKANAFQYSILAGLGSAAIVMDRQFNILSWSRKAEELWGVRSEEVQGQSLFDLDIGLPVRELRSPIQRCFAGETESQELVLQATNRRGRSINCHIIITPLLNLEGDCHGSILLMEESQPN